MSHTRILYCCWEGNTHTLPYNLCTWHTSLQNKLIPRDVSTHELAETDLTCCACKRQGNGAQRPMGDPCQVWTSACMSQQQHHVNHMTFKVINLMHVAACKVQLTQSIANRLRP